MARCAISPRVALSAELLSWGFLGVTTGGRPAPAVTSTAAPRRRLERREAESVPRSGSRTPPVEAPRPARRFTSGHHWITPHQRDDNLPRSSPSGRPVRSQVASSGMSRNWSSASGLASASRFFTGRPWITSRTASSTILPLLVRGMSATWTILRRHVARRRVLADAHRGCAPASASSSADAVAQPDEQHDALVALPLLPDHERLDDLVELLDLPVDLRRADAHAARVQHGIGSAVDDDAAVRGDLGPVPVTPHAREHARSRPRGTCVRRGRSRSRAASTGTAACRRVRPAARRTGWPSSSNTSTSMPRPRAWISPRQTGAVGIAADEAADDVGAAGDRGQVHVRA